MGKIDGNRPRSTSKRHFLLMFLLLISMPMIAGQASEDPPEKAAGEAQALRGRVVEIYAREAEGYAFFRDSRRAEKLTLRREPVYFWSNPTRAGGQDGAIFVWTCRGRAEVVGTIFSFPGKGRRQIDHEFLSLATTVLDVERAGPQSPEAMAWSPRVPGVLLKAMTGAPAVAKSTALRLAQMRDLARNFSGTTEDQKGQRWDLRLLPKPLYRYESTDPEVVDGAVFAFATSAGTDPEAILVLEARKGTGSAEASWQFAVGRYTDMALRVRLEDREVLSVPFLSGSNPEDRYHVLNDRVIPPIEEGDLPPRTTKP